MQAIITKNLPFTEHKPARVKATTGNGEHSFTLSVGKLEEYLTENNRTQENIHRVCADLLAVGLNWKGTLVGGDTKDGFVFVFSPRPEIPNYLGDDAAIVAGGIIARDFGLKDAPDPEHPMRLYATAAGVFSGSGIARRVHRIIQNVCAQQ